MKIGDKVKCLTSIFIIPSKEAVGYILDIAENSILVKFPNEEKCLWMKDYEIEVIE